MNHKSWLFLLAFLLIKIVVGENDVAISDAEVKDHELSNEEEKPNKEPFIATNEWQVIKPGQAIPAGLHVRMNFQTGIKEAKLMENESPSLKVTLNNQEGASNQKIYFTKDELKKKMKDFQDKIGTEDIIHDAHWSEEAKQHETEIRSKFRSMKEIQKDLEDSMGWKIKSDLDVMKTSLSLLEGKTLSIKEKAALLDNIEYYVHQIDNARDLEKIGGLRKIVLMLNHSSSELLQERSANVIGAAAQSNGVVQDAVREHGGVDILVKLLHTQRSPATWKKALFALSAVVRGNHANQQRMIQLGGLATLMEFVSARQNIKALTLLYDLIVEQNEVGPKSRSPLLDSLVHHGWCDVIVPLLQSDDLDRQEKTMQAIDVSVPACRASWQHHPHAIEVMDSAWQHLQDLINEEEDADHKSYLAELVQTMAAILRRVNKH